MTVMQCKHQLAARLASALKMVQLVSVPDLTVADLLMQ